MNKEELEKESQQYTLSHTTPSLYRVVDQAYLAGAEPREKRIAELEEENADLKEEINKIAFARGELEKENNKLILGNKSLSEKLTSVTREKLDLQKEITELKKVFADCDTCKRTCDIGNCCKFGSAYLPDVEKVLNEQKQLTKAKDLLLKLSTCLEGHSNNNFEYELIKEAEQFISEVEK